MPPTMDIVPFQPEAWPQVQAFLRAQYPDGPLKSDPTYFQWKFAGHPDGSALPAYHLATDGGAVVGQLGLQTGRLLIGGKAYPCYSCADLVIAETHRKTPALWG